MSPPLPWKIQPKKHILSSKGIEFEILDYGSLLVGELDYLKSMDRAISEDRFVREFVAFCLRFRYQAEIPEGTTDEQLLEGMPAHLITAIFNFLVHGPEGKPSAEVKPTTKKILSQTGASFSGDSSSTTLATPISTKPTTSGAQPALLTRPSRPTRKSA